MKKASLRRTLCLAMATITAVCFTACGNAGGTAAESNAASATSGLEAQGIIEVVDVNPDGAAGETTAPVTNRKFQGAIVDKYPEADYIEAIADGRFVILFRDYQNMKTDVRVYDIENDKELSQFTVYNCDTYTLNPVIFYGKGFGFVTPHSGSKRGVYAYYYDTDGKLINKFDKKYDDELNSSSVLASDGSALYVVVDNRVQCACGYDLKPDYTTEIIKVYPDGSEEKLAEYDSHYMIYPIGVTFEGRLVLLFRYDSADKKAMTHEDYERMEMVAAPVGSNGDAAQVEMGYAFMNTDQGAVHELDKFYLTDRFHQHCFINGNTITLMNDDEIINIVPDENGQYKGLRYEPDFEVRSGQYYAYETSSGRYLIISELSQDCKDTTINVLRLENDNIELVFQKSYEGCRIDMDYIYKRVVFDEETGDLFGELDETADGGMKGLLYHDNIFED